MRRTVLVVEDSATQAERLRLLLEGEGYRVDVVPNGRQALARIRVAPPDLVVSDVVMPEMDGYALCRAVRMADAARRTPIVLLTDLRTPFDIIRGLEAGADNFITKPFEEEYLLERLRRMVEGLERRCSGGLEVEVSLRVGHQEILISADKQQIIEFLFAASEELGRAHARLGQAQRELEDRARALEADVEARTAELRGLFDGVPVGLLRTTPDGRVLDANPAAVQILGYPGREPLLAAGVLDLWESAEERTQLLRRLHAEGVVHGYETRCRRPDGTTICVRLSFRVVRDPTGRTLHYEGALEDVTDRARLQDRLRQVAKMEAVGQLAGGIAHDFNNLLTIITGRTQLVAERLAPGNPLRADLELILQAAGRATALTRQLLAFSRKQVLQPKVFDLNALVSGIEAMLRSLIGEGVELVFRPADRLGRVKADPGQLEQLILNLAVNARDAMPDGGTLAIETANLELDAMFVRTHPGASPGRHVALTVRDTGIGMDAETLARVFEPFFTTKPVGRGTGLGLATVYGIVKQSGGYVAVESAPGRGTAFRVYLPEVEDPLSPPEAPAPPDRPARASETVLLVEDEEALAELAREVLELEGYHVLVAGAPHEGLRLATEHPGPIHLLLTDVIMPGMNGRALARALAAVRPDLRVLYMSGYTDDAIVRHGALEAGSAFLPKPFTPASLTRKVRDTLDGPPPPWPAA
jgi:two-component system cell cycle sensor histidine kinase/response regulator CckA